MAKTPTNKIPGPERGYVEMLDEALIEDDKKNQVEMRQKKNPLRPSSAGECARKLAYSYREYLGLDPVTVEEREARIVRIFDLGHHIETHILRLYRKVKGINANVYNQQVVGVVEYDDGSITEGQIDMCFTSDEVDGLGVGDAKSKGDKFSYSHKSKWDEDAEKYAKMKSVQMISPQYFFIENLDDFLDELRDPFFSMNFYQLNGYIHSEFLQRRSADHGTIIQYNKNDSRMREFRFIPSREAYQYVVDKYKFVRENAPQDAELVEKEFTLGSIKCAFCPYASKCWPEDDAKRSFFDTFPKTKFPTKTATLGQLGHTLEELYESYQLASEMTNIKVDAEAELCRLMEQNRIRRIRFSDNAIFDLRKLKTGLVIRRSKL